MTKMSKSKSKKVMYILGNAQRKQKRSTIWHNNHGNTLINFGISIIILTGNKYGITNIKSVKKQLCHHNYDNGL